MFNLFDCFRQPNTEFFDHCVCNMRIAAKYSDGENEKFAFRIVALAYLTRIPFDPIKEDGLLARLQDLRGKKIFHDARIALAFVKRGRPQDDLIYPARAIQKYGGGHVDIATFTERWRALVE